MEEENFVMNNTVCLSFRFLATQEGCLTISIRIHINMSMSITISIRSRSPAILLQKCAHRSPMTLAHLIHAHLQ